MSRSAVQAPVPHTPPGPARGTLSGGGVEECLRRAAQRRSLPGVGHHVREGAARRGGRRCLRRAASRRMATTSPAHHRSAQVAGRRLLDREACRRDRRWRDGGAGPPAVSGGGAGRGRERPVACSKAAMAPSRLVRLSSGSRVLPAASRPVQRTSP